MTKFLKSVLTVSCAMAMTCGVAMFTACGGGDDSSVNTNTSTGSSEKPETIQYTVTFETNGGSTVANQKVDKGEHAVQPNDPEKTDYIFEGWYKEASFTTIYDFETEVVNSDITIYANWTAKPSDSDTYVATFYYNYDGASNGGVFTTKEFAKGSKLRKPGDPTREGYTFNGWYVDAQCTTAFVNNSVYEGDQSFYASWIKTYTFEAEDTQLTGLPKSDITAKNGNKIGHGFSNDFTGAGLIGNDTAASGGKAVHGIYYEGAYLDFEITSNKAEKGVTLSIRVAAEFRTVTLNQDDFQVIVNDEEVTYKYGATTLADGTDFTDSVWDKGEPHVYQEVIINSIDLEEGENLIRLYVNNGKAMSAGTCQAMAPIVDCIYLKSSSDLTMTKYENK